MTKRQFVVLAFRLFALYLVFNSLTSLATFYGILQTDVLVGSSNIVASIFAIALALLAFAFLIWLFWARSEWLMARVIAVPALMDEEEGESPSEQAASGISDRPLHAADVDAYDERVTPNSIGQVAFGFVGLYATLNILPHFLRELDRALFPGYARPEEILRYLVPDALTIGIGVWLFLQPWRFQEWTMKLVKQPDGDATHANDTLGS